MWAREELTEATWGKADAEWILHDIWQIAPSSRKSRLAVCAIARQIWDLMIDDRCRAAIVIGERYADGVASQSDLETAAVAVFESQFSPDQVGEATSWACNIARVAVSPSDNYRDDWKVGSSMRLLRRYTENRNIGPVVRDIFGNPFRPVAVNPSWLTSTVVSLATSIYEERAFDRLPILADALEDAGCDNADILNHCRSEGPHVRGCWALDLVLNKK